ncbi:MAG TPA: hypothetical protein EYQ54_22025 [Myxococcales bacterium]|nr:hypothetical protein [Myxococcales bacterium]HIL79968.1 hypothetical protein [Myxococcales bacterium]
MTRTPIPLAPPERHLFYGPARKGVGILLAILLIGLVPARATASPETLRRGLGNVMMGPFDMALSPVQGLNTLVRNLEEIDDSKGVRIFYAVPGWGWLSLLDFGGGMIRTLTGILELIPGVLVFAFETDVDPLFDPVEDAGALLAWDNPLIEIEDPWVYYNPVVAPFAIRIKMGIDYTRPDY